MGPWLRGRKGVKAEDGVVLIESALSLPIYFMILFGIVWVTYTIYCMHALNYVTNEVARWLLLGQTINNQSREDSAKQLAVQKGKTFFIHLNPQDIRICPLQTPDCLVDDAGGKETSFVISISKNINLLASEAFPALYITRSAIGRNEPFVVGG